MNKKLIPCISIIILLLGLLSTTCHASAEAKVFSNGLSPVYKNCAAYASSGLNKLGYYPCTSAAGTITKSEMLQYISRTDNNYGLYYHGLGGQGYFIDYYRNNISASDLSGYWDFVFIDSSESARDYTLSNALHTTNIANRVFVGWHDVVSYGNAETFNYYFWLEEVGRGSSIVSCAVNAAACVSGSNSAPIRVFGSSTYTGVAR